jgi:hypothetical protein
MKSRRLIYVLSVCIMLMALLMAGCGSNSSETPEVSDASENNASSTEVTQTVTDVSLVSSIEESTEFATINGTDADGNTVWTVETEGYPAAQLTAFADIGIYEDQYFYVENGSVVSLDVQTGSVNWKNPDFGGSPSQNCHLIDSENGNIYLSGYFGPDFYAVDKSGTTLKRIQQVDSDYFWPCELTVDGDNVTIKMEGTSNGEQEGEVSFKMSDY